MNLQTLSQHDQAVAYRWLYLRFSPDTGHTKYIEILDTSLQVETKIVIFTYTLVGWPIYVDVLLLYMNFEYISLGLS